MVNSKIKIKLGSITDSSFVVDAIVNSTNEKLDLSVGVVSSEILRQSGSVIQNELKNKYPNGIKTNEIAQSSNGNMKNKKMIFHTVLGNWDLKNTNKIKDQLKEIIMEILRLTEQNKLKSIAFPALGVGVLGYPKSEVPTLMYEYINNYFSKNTNSNIQTVYIVVYDKDKECVKEFENFEKSLTTKDDNNNVANDFVYIDKIVNNNDNNDTTFNVVNFKKSNGSTCFEYLKTTIKIYTGDITQSTNDAIFNPMNSTLQKGAVSKALLNVEPDLDNHWNGLKKNFDKVAFYNCKPGSKLKSKVILDVDVHTDDYLQIALDEVDKLNYKSITLPFIGTGNNNGDPKSCCINLFESIIAYLEKNKTKTKIARIDICIYDAQSSYFSIFTDTIESYTKPSKPQTSILKSIFSPFVKLVNHFTKPNHPIATNENSNTGKYEILFEIISNRKQVLHDVKEQIKDISKKELLEYDYSESVIEFTKDHRKQIESKCQADFVKIIWSNNHKTFKLVGIKDKVMDCSKFIHNCVTANLLASKFQWQYFENNKWVNFSVFLNKEFEKNYIAYCANSNYDKFDFIDENGEKCSASMKDKKIYQNTNQLDIQRIDLQNTFNNLPPSWDQNKEEDLITLVPKSKEYDYVQGFFKNQGLDKYLKNIVSIQRIQNKSLYLQYIIFKENVQRQCPNKSIERKVFHGTSANCLENIWKTGFNRSYAGINGVVYGQGVYFARDSSYSHNYTDLTQNGKTKGHMFLCNIVVGKMTVGKLNIFLNKYFRKELILLHTYKR